MRHCAVHQNMCDFFAYRIRLLDNGLCLVFVAFILALFGNCTVGPLCVSCMSVRNNWSPCATNYLMRHFQILQL